MRNSYHGGGCCGMRHLWSFDGASDAQLDLDISQIERDEFGMTNRRRVIEVVLTDGQLRQNPWASRLRARGFFPVSRFHNSNSGNVCTIFHRHPDGDTRLNLDQVPGWDTPYEAPQPAAPRVQTPAANPFIVGQTVDCIEGTPELRTVRHAVIGVDGGTIRVAGLPSWYSARRFIAVIDEAPPAEPRRPLRVGDRVRRIDGGGGCGFMPVGGEMVVTVVPDYYTMVEGVYDGRNVHLLQRRFELIEDEPEVTVVRTSFHNVYPRTGRSDIGWETLEEANRWNARAARIGVDRHQIFSDGTETWERLDNA